MIFKGDIPLVHHVAGMGHFVIKKGLLFGGESGCGNCLEFVPVGLAAKELCLPPNRSRLERCTLGVGHAGQRPSEGFQNGATQQRSPDGRDAKHGNNGGADQKSNEESV